eukprot:1919141-Pleurochrysis_carterae.AAC.1
MPPPAGAAAPATAARAAARAARIVTSARLAASRSCSCICATAVPMSIGCPPPRVRRRIASLLSLLKSSLNNPSPRSMSRVPSPEQACRASSTMPNE